MSLLDKGINILKIMRPWHYIKNIIIFAPLFFAKVEEKEIWVSVFVKFILFCLVASLIYVVNDYIDIENDRKHPIKSQRPLAAGKISKLEAKILILILSMLILFPIFIDFYTNIKVYLILFGYILLNILYSKVFKHKPIADIFILMMFYIIRLFYGSIASGISISSWLYLTVIFGALFLGLGKRRNERRNFGETITRKVLGKYSYEFLDKNMYVNMALTITFYTLWCEKVGIIFTVPLLIACLMQYSLLIEGESDADPIEVIIHNKVLLILGAIYAISLVIGVWII